MFIRVVAWILISVFVLEAPAFALGGKSVAYMGGTVATFQGAKDPIEGTLDTSSPTHLTFSTTTKPFQSTKVEIPYSSITEIEYGQKAGRRVGAAIGSAVLLGPVGLFMLFSKKRNHFLTVSYTDGAGVEQATIFELGKDLVRTTLTVVETRSGKEISYTDDEAKKQYGGS